VPDQPGTPDWPGRGLPKTAAALAYAKQVHRDQRRPEDGAPFSLHLLEVASLLYRAGASDQLIAAGVLHDTLEKTVATEADLHDRFGAHIARLVVAVSEDTRIDGYAPRKAALREQVAGAGEEALTLLAADKVSKVRAMTLGAVDPQRVAADTPARVHQLAHYRRCLDLLQDLLPDSPLVEELNTELKRLFAREPSLCGKR
jgi:(p)ppGpp synthase/HD superfamily hydrolase